MTNKILVVDDDKAIADSTAIYLNNDGYEVRIAPDGITALDILQRDTINLVLMDIMMPKLDGIKTMERIRKTSNIPIILLTAKSEESDKVYGLLSGADDYITKPFSPTELLARVKSALRRSIVFNQTPAMGEIIIGSLAFDGLNKKVTVDGEQVKLTNLEYRILELFCKHPNRIFSAEEIYRAVWNEDVFVNDNTIAVHIRRIREKIEIDPKNPKLLKVVYGIGYKLEKL
ncbi:MAG: response regulator transcription factor [Clostridiales bacterium]|nr:response regulator transcription factor [Clostridiales bacterium]